MKAIIIISCVFLLNISFAEVSIELLSEKLKSEVRSFYLDEEIKLNFKINSVDIGKVDVLGDLYMSVPSGQLVPLKRRIPLYSSKRTSRAVFEYLINAENFKKETHLFLKVWVREKDRSKYISKLNVFVNLYPRDLLVSSFAFEKSSKFFLQGKSQIIEKIFKDNSIKYEIIDHLKDDFPINSYVIFFDEINFPKKLLEGQVFIFFEDIKSRIPIVQIKKKNVGLLIKINKYFLKKGNASELQKLLSDLINENRR